METVPLKFNGSEKFEILKNLILRSFPKLVSSQILHELYIVICFHSVNIGKFSEKILKNYASLNLWISSALAILLKFAKSGRFEICITLFLIV